jgi:hypothetical protein
MFGYYARCSWLGLSELALALCCTFSLLQATLTIGSKEHQFVGNPVAKQTLLRLTTSEDDNGGVVASITHKLHQRVSVADSQVNWQLTSTLTDDIVCHQPWVYNEQPLDVDGQAQLLLLLPLFLCSRTLCFCQIQSS